MKKKEACEIVALSMLIGFVDFCKYHNLNTGEMLARMNDLHMEGILRAYGVGK